MAATSRQDLAGAFSTETVKASYDINFDAVDEIPSQIPWKPVTIPASSLAPQNSPAKAQGDFKDPPEEVEIHVYDPFPLPPQDSADLSVPRIRSRLNYDLIPIKFAYLFDVED